MCLALIAFARASALPLVVAANRDEYHARPAAPAAWWDEGFLAGRDLKAGGTWLGVDRRGRFALLTNVREPSRHDPGAPSRGALVPSLLTASAPPSVSLPAQVARRRRAQRLQPDRRRCRRARSGARTARRRRSTLGPGIYGVSNHLLDTPWPKVERTKAAFRRWCEADATRDDLAAALRAPARYRARARRGAAGHRRHARAGADAVVALHRQRRTTARAARPS